MGNNNLFTAVGLEEGLKGRNLLNSTAQLTNQAMDIANKILQVVTTDEAFADDVRASQQDHQAMDNLIEKVHPLSEVDVEYLKAESEETADKMIRSQQSKRSRSKSKTMTLENYRTMLVGAIAENLLRLAFNKPKGTYSGGGNSGSVTYTDEELAIFEQNPDMLTKAIRNVQSKKSIAKSKADFSEASERWQLLLEAEHQLKEVRSRLTGVASTEAKQAIEKTNKAEELLSEVDVGGMSAKEAKELLANMKEILASR